MSNGSWLDIPDRVNGRSNPHVTMWAQYSGYGPAIIDIANQEEEYSDFFVYKIALEYKLYTFVSIKGARQY